MYMIRLYFSFILISSLVTINAQTISKNIIVDQFGYLPDSKKIAIIKNPVVGFDAVKSFIPGATYILVNANTGDHVFTAGLTAWNAGQTDASSGDKVWYFDFSSIKQNGRYFILDLDKNLRSFEFEISPVVYKEVLKQAVRFFYYQRSGFPKEAKYAGIGWADGASHIGPLQDKNCRIFTDKYNPATEIDVSGGWYDAGDYNKYTNWTAGYIVEMMKAYLENPLAWGDDYNIPESGNSIPDLLDEAKWGIDFLLRMQRPDGCVLCIVSEAAASPPSSATGQSMYGPATTSASLNAAAAFALSSKVYRSINMGSYADTLVARALKAWNWAKLNPNVIFNNNSAENSSLGVGAGNQEEDDYTRSMTHLKAACFLFEITKDTAYRNYFDSNYQSSRLFPNAFAYPFETTIQDVLLYYSKIDGATVSVATTIKNIYNNAMVNYTDNFPSYYSKKDPYLAHLGAYTWGSNSIKSCEGNMYFDMITYAINPAKYTDAREAALGYIHYINGVNPLNMTYLSNMYHYGGKNCVNAFYHSWFAHGSAKWDRVGVSTYGPPPGYLTGGANPGYNWNTCCPTNCGSTTNNAGCFAENISPPKNQPDQKSYKDFNDSWPLDSWEVTEPDCGYQINYIRLLSKFVIASMDCNGDTNGIARMDTCKICSGGNTGRVPDSSVCNCSKFQRSSNIYVSACKTYNSPSGKYAWTNSGTYTDTITASIGCDSVITIHLNLFQNTSSVLDLHACETYSSPSRKFNWTNSGVYYDTIPSAGGCDSIITINLEIIRASRDSFSVTACKNYTSPSGKKIWSHSGVFSDTIHNAAGCDSILTVNLVINNLNKTVIQKGDSLIANATSASYQWLDCGNNFSNIEGATGSVFNSSLTGDFAVMITQNNCIDTSDCYHLISTGILFNSEGQKIRLYPNPSSGEFMVDLPEIYKKVEIEIKNELGESIGKEIFYNTSQLSLSLKEPKGIYFLFIKNDKDQKSIIKMLLQ
jgi:endoglucanase